MPSVHRSLVASAVVGSLLWLDPSPARAQSVSPVTTAPAAAVTPTSTAAAAVVAPTVQPDYHPSLGDLMTMAVQPRHIKLGLAGQQSNWAYATYELSELRNAFARSGRTIPKYNSIDTAAVFEAMTKAPLDAIEQAVKAGSPAQFKAAYAALTATCNACHISLNHAAVVIKVPSAADSFPDQDFRLPRR